MHRIRFGWSLLALILLFSCSKTPPPEKFAEGKQLLDAGKYAEAQAYFEGQIAAAPTDPEAYYFAGRSAAMSAEYPAAETHLLKAIELSPEVSAYHDWLGRIYGVQARYGDLGIKIRLAAKIQRAFEKAVELDPNNREAKAFLGIFYMEAPPRMGGDKAKGEAIARELLTVDPLVGHRLLANFYKTQKDPVQAEAELQEVVKLAPEDPASYSGLGDHFAGQKQFDKAMENYNKALSMDPEDRNSLYGIAQVAVNAPHLTDNGIASIRKCLDLPKTIESPSAGVSHHLLGFFYERKAMKNEAIAEYEEAVRQGYMTSQRLLEALKAPPAAPVAADAATTGTLPVAAGDGVTTGAMSLAPGAGQATTTETLASAAQNADQAATATAAAPQTP